MSTNIPTSTTNITYDDDEHKEETGSFSSSSSLQIPEHIYKSTDKENFPAWLQMA